MKRLLIDRHPFQSEHDGVLFSRNEMKRRKKKSKYSFSLPGSTKEGSCKIL